jgi:hypothetical protein
MGNTSKEHCIRSFHIAGNSKIIQLLSFDEVNVWIYWLLKKNDIHWARNGEVNIIFFKSINPHIYKIKTLNVLFYIFEEIVVFWNKKLHVHCPCVVLHYCLHHHAISAYLSFNIVFNIPSYKVANLGFEHRLQTTFCFCIDGCGKWTTCLHWLIKIEYS